MVWWGLNLGGAREEAPERECRIDQLTRKQPARITKVKMKLIWIDEA